MNAAERILALRGKMQAAGVDVALMTSSDDHASEYVGDYYKVTEFFSGCTSDNVVLVVTAKEACLWTDGRFFISAEAELAGSGICLMKMGEPGVPKVTEYLEEVLSYYNRRKTGGQNEGPIDKEGTWAGKGKEEACVSQRSEEEASSMKKAEDDAFENAAILAYDGRCVTAAAGLRYREIAAKTGANVRADFDPAEGIWQDRPERAKNPVFFLDVTITGATFAEKLKRVREAMEKEGAAVHVLEKLDDICWLLNLRSFDIECNPVALSYLVIGREDVHLFLQEEERTDELYDFVLANGITLHPYGEYFTFLRQMSLPGKVLFDKKGVSDATYSILAERCSFGDEELMKSDEESYLRYEKTNEILRFAQNDKKQPVSTTKMSRNEGRGGASTNILDKPNPTELMKAVKNPVEIENIKKFYLLDSVALCKFLCWFDRTLGKEPLNELTVAAKLDGLRAEVPGFLELSFPTISAYGANAAMAHYAATSESYAEIGDRGFYLVDSGGQYLGATTDVTRTVVCGPLTDEEKKAFTLVVAANLNLQNARFLEGTGGVLLDAYARSVLWEHAMQYNHGTGHGIGYVLNVHEGPQSVRWKATAEHPDTPFEPGMLVSDEPGMYVEGKYGIRIETILLCEKDVENEFGSFLHFVPLTLAPIDLRGLDSEYLSKKDVERLNSYHALVWEKVSPYLEGEELAWLEEATKKFGA